MKKIASIVLAALLIAVLWIPAFAASAVGTITINPAVKGETYKIYKIFDATFGTDTAAYTYTCADDSDAFLAQLQSAGSPFTVTYHEKTAYSYVVSLKTGKTAADISAFLKANETLLTSPTEKTAESTTVTFDSVPYGYYYVTTTTGTFVSLDSSATAVTIGDKNAPPSVDVKVKRTADSFADSNTATVGETLTYQVTITAGKGAQNYVLTETLTNLASLSAVTVKAKLGTAAEKALTDGTEYTYATALSGTGFTLTFSQDDFLKNVKENDTVTVTYTAKVAETANENAKSVATVKYGTSNGSVNDTATSTLLNFKLNKTDGTNALSGVTFKLYTDEAHSNALAFKVSGNTYKVTDETTGVTEVITTNGAELTVTGLGAGNYYLHEESTLDGYNILTKDVKVSLAEDGTLKVNDASATNVTVVNKKGTALPITGGTGTTLFVTFGTIAVLVTGVFLVTNKRISKEMME